MRTIIAAIAAFTCLASEASAREHRFFADIAVSSALNDRGEQIAAGVAEATFGLEAEIGEVMVYGAVYRLAPLGPHQSAFDDEVDYTMGAVWAGEGYELDIAANWLTFPGADTKSGLELAAAVTFDRALEPAISGFYDTEHECWGLELVAGPEWVNDDWTIYALARGGFVNNRGEDADRSYGGAEVGFAKAVSPNASVAVYGRVDVADEEAFVRHLAGGGIQASKSAGGAMGVVLSVAY
ncbi:MAG: hypothetical protein IPK75_17525 [Acidobacteria bacterium]|nr:hypothetical protein [Acidobacteriota bacterium]